MADNATSASGPTVATDDIAGIHYQRTKLVWGVDGVATDASATNPLPVLPAPSATGTLSSVTASATSVTILASNPGRRGALIYNDSTATLALAFAATASLTAFSVELPPQSYYEMPAPLYTGVLSGIWTAAAGAARITELT